MKKLIFTAGLPGAGKSTVIKKSEYANLPCVDPDAIKESFEGYDPKHPEVFHEASKKLARQKQLRFLSDDVSFIMDGTGTNVEKYLTWFQEARELGYQIEVIYVKVSVATSIKRNANRERVVPTQIIMEKATVIETAMDLLGSVADKYTVINND